MFNNTPTVEQIAKNYSACIDSVNLINGPKPIDMSTTQWTEIIKINKDHLKLMLTRDYWTIEDLTLIQLASV